MAGCTLSSIIRRKVAMMDEHRTVLEAAKLMIEKNCGSVVVTDGEPVVGFFTERDLMTRVVGKKKDPHITSLGDVCTRDLIKVQASMSCRDGLELMRSNKIRHLLVWDGTQFSGVVSLRDLAGFLGEKVALRDRFANILTALVFALVVGVIGLLLFFIPKMLEITERIQP